MAKSEFQSHIRYVSRIHFLSVYTTSYSINSKYFTVYQQSGEMPKSFTSIFFFTLQLLPSHSHHNLTGCSSMVPTSSTLSIFSAICAHSIFKYSVTQTHGPGPMSGNVIPVQVALQPDFRKITFIQQRLLIICLSFIQNNEKESA